MSFNSNEHVKSRAATGEGKNHNGRRIDLELKLLSRMDDHAVDEHYMTREGRNYNKDKGTIKSMSLRYDATMSHCRRAALLSVPFEEDPSEQKSNF